MSDDILGSLVGSVMEGMFIGSVIGLGVVAYEMHQDRKSEERKKERDWQSEENRKMREHFAQYARRS